MTTQNLATLNLTDAQVAAVEAALTQLEDQLSGLITLTALQKKQFQTMGAKSESFCRQALNVMGQNPQLFPVSLPLAEAQLDLVALDRLRPLVLRISRLQERASDTQHALGADVLAVALRGYAQLKVSGRSEGLDPVRRELSARFVRTPRAKAVAAA